MFWFIRKIVCIVKNINFGEKNAKIKREYFGKQVFRLSPSKYNLQRVSIYDGWNSVF